jgi:hypothetical protein
MRTRVAVLRFRARRGAALVAAILLIVVAGVLATTSLLIGTSEGETADDRRASLDAYVLARTGLDSFAVNRTGLGFSGVPAASESTRIAYANGYADVILTRLRPAGGPGAFATYLLRSHGVVTRRRMRGAPDAERTLTRVARWQDGSMTALSAWTSLSGLTKSGGAGTISGVDACGAKATVAGVAVPTVPGYVQSGGALVPNGAPNVLDLGTAAQAAAAVGVDWDGIVNGNAMAADISFPGGAWPSSSAWSNPAFWPIIRFDGNASLPGDGRGLLIVTGDLTISGSRDWRGVILVGGSMTSTGNTYVRGSVLSGLNVLLGLPTGPADLWSGGKAFIYDSCAISSAVARFAGLSLVPGTLADNWPAY